MKRLLFRKIHYWGLLLTLTMLSLTPLTARSAQTRIYTLEDDLIKLANAHFEVALNTADGGIAYLLDKSTEQYISDGNVGGNLWFATLDNNQIIPSSSYAGQFTHEWDETGGVLTLNYPGDLAVQVTIFATDAPALKFQALVTNNTGTIISDFQFPGQLKIAKADVNDALLPMLPGALISSVFFDEGRTFVNLYPGVMFADYLALRSARGELALYSGRGQVIQPILLGFEELADEPDYTTLTHKYQTWIADGTTWNSPSVVVSIGQDYPATIQGYRADNAIDQYPSLVDKLGDAAQAYFAAPMYKLDLMVYRLTFPELRDAIIAKMNVPGMVHLVAFQPRGHDKNYPDFIPPDTKWGTTDDFAAFVEFIHEHGSLAVPYTNFSWWYSGGPSMTTLPKDIPLNTLVAIKDSNGLPAFETHTGTTGFVMNLHNAFVQDKISEQHEALLHTVGMDGIFEDQWGARNVPYDFNAAGLDTYDPSTSYFEGILNHYRTHADHNLMTEVGVDALANDGVAFMGTNYLWDMLGYRGATAGVTTYYPMAGMLLRDKVLLYQHNLAAETWTDDKDMLRWNLAQGYGLSIAFVDSASGVLNMDNPWLNVVGVFQKYALANYADERVLSYDDLGDNVTRTVFPSYTVHANWDMENEYQVAGHTLPPGGVITQADDGSVTAGVFTAYNHSPLSEGEHYLVEIQSGDSIRLFQPLGDDTALHVRNAPGWEAVTVTAYAYDGTLIAPVDAVVNGEEIQFTYAREQDGKAVGYYEIVAGGDSSS